MHTEKTTRGVIFLTISSLIVKFAGLLFKIPLTALIGEEGMGYFNSAYSLFTWFYTISTAGLPVAAAMLVSKSRSRGRAAEVKRILHVSMLIFLGLGTLGSAAMLFGADLLASLIKVERSRAAMLVIAPTLFLICQSAALRGYFQGLGMLLPHAISQVAEALGKLFLGLALANYAVSRGEAPEIAAAWAAGGLTVGIGLGMVILYLSLLFTKRAREGSTPDSMPSREIAKRLVLVALPITLSSSLMSLTAILDTLIMTRRLHDIGFSQSETVAIYGNYSSLAVPMYNLPPVLIYPLTYALMPELTAAVGRDDREALRLCRRTLRLTAAISIPCAVGMSALSEPILALLFDPALAGRGAGMLTLLAPSSFLLCLLALTNTVLQACGRERASLLAMLIGCAVKPVSSWLLIPLIGKYGTPVSTFLCYLTTLAVSFCFIETGTPLKGLIDPESFLIWFVGAGFAVGAASMLCPLIGIIPSIAAAGVVYAAVCGRSLLGLIRAAPPSSDGALTS